LPVAIADMLHEAEAESMRRLRDSIDREIELYAQQHKKNQQRIAEELTHQAANAAALEVYLNGLVARASTGDDVVVSIPTTIQVAVVGGPSIDALMSIVSAAGSEDDEARNAARYLPHPGDVASMLDGLGIDPAWSRRFHELAEQMTEADRKSSSPVTRVQAEGGLMLFGALKEERRLLDAYGADRLFRLVTDPTSIKSSTQPPPRFGRVPDAALSAAMKHVRS
jgi:hypothetical protein